MSRPLRTMSVFQNSSSSQAMECPMAGQSLGIGLSTCAAMINTSPRPSNGFTKQEEMATFPTTFEMSFSAHKLLWEVSERNSPYSVPEWFKGLCSVFKRRQVTAQGCWESLFQVNQNKLPLVYRDGISLHLDLLMIITLGTKAHILDPKCQELMFFGSYVCIYLLSQGEKHGWRCSGGVGSGGNRASVRAAQILQRLIKSHFLTEHTEPT